MRTFFYCMFWAAFFSCIAQLPQTQAQAEKKNPAKPAAVDVELLEPTSKAFIVTCDSQPSKTIVLDSDGKWISNVKSVEVKFDIGGSGGIITCVMYDGLIRPTKPTVKSWILGQMKTVPAAEFQQLIDNLQVDPEAVKAFLK